VSIHQKLVRTAASLEAHCAEVEAWTAFWQEQQADSRCLERAPGVVRQLLSSHWTAFADRFLVSTEVIDLGCGSGFVGAELADANPFVAATGIDVAAVDHAGRARMNIHGGVLMESLPFDDASFDAAVSQFGFEYSRVKLTAREVARVLKPGAPLSFLVHHAQSPIVFAEAVHERALRALTACQISAPFLSGDITSLRSALRLLEWQYRGNSTISLAAQCLAKQVVLVPQARLKVWQALVEALAPELVLCASLRSSCVAPDDLDDWLRPLSEGFLCTSAWPLVAAGEPLAWTIEALRAD
jgi:SAM-dependent methyltransferase